MQIREILDGIKNLSMVMPEFQREYVWSLDNAKQLMVSLVKGYPTGSLLFWQAKADDIPEIKNNAVDRTKLGSVQVILDGQQRITTLYLLIKGEIPPYYNASDLTNDPRHLFYNLKTGEFLYYMKKKMDGNPLWQSVVDCFDIQKINAVRIAKLSNEKDESVNFEELIEEINDNLNRLRQVEHIDYPVQSVPSNAKIDEAIDVFDRVNSKGTKLTDAELVLTHITGKWPHARRVIKEKMAEIKNEGFELNLDLLTRFMVVALTGSALFDKNAKLTFELFTEALYKSTWDKVSKSLDYLIPILKQDGLISSSNDMNTLNVMVPIMARLLRHEISLSQEMKFGYLYWMYLALIWSRYSGQTDQRLDKDVYISINSQNPIDELVYEIQDQRGRIEVQETDLVGRGSGHPLYRMLYIITKWNKAVDWSNGSSIYGTIGDYYSIHSHHIFPQDVLYKNGYISDNHIDQKKVNEIANRAFITRDTNYQISNKPPIDYLSAITDKYPDILKKHLIPEEKSLWTVENYERFLEVRRGLIAARINEFLQMLKSSAKSEADSVVSVDWLELIEKGENNFIEFKSSIRWDYKQSVVNKELEHVIAKTISAFMNTEGGKLIIGVDDDGNILGLDNDFKTLGNKQNIDGFLLQIDSIVNSYLGKEFHEYINVVIENISGRDICIIDISDSSQPVFVQNQGKDEFFIRASASSQPLSMREATDYIAVHWADK